MRGHRGVVSVFPNNLGFATVARRCLRLLAVLCLVTAFIPSALAQDRAINTATITVPDGVIDPDPGNNTATDDDPIVSVTIAKGADPASGEPVVAGSTITYTLTATVTGAATTQAVTFTDTLGVGLTVGTLPADCSAAGQVITCTLAAGAAAGSHTFVYTATVDVDATGTVANSVSGGHGCTTPMGCVTEHEVEPPTITVAKSADPADGSQVQPGQTLTYTLTATVEVSATTEPLVLTDTLGAGLTFGAVTDSGAFACAGELSCTLPAGTLPGTYAVTYTATVNQDATGSVGNSVVATGGGGDEDPDCTSCSTEHEVEATSITVVKTADPADGSEVRPGDTRTYTLTATVEVSATTEPLVLTVTLGAGLTFGVVTLSVPVALPIELSCTLPAGTLPGTYAV